MKREKDKMMRMVTMWKCLMSSVCVRVVCLEPVRMFQEETVEGEKEYVVNKKKKKVGVEEEVSLYELFSLESRTQQSTGPMNQRRQSMEWLQ